MGIFEGVVIATQIHQSWTQRQILSSVEDIHSTLENIEESFAQVRNFQAQQIADQKRLESIRELVYTHGKQIKDAAVDDNQPISVVCYHALRFARMCRVYAIGSGSFPTFDDKDYFDSVLHDAKTVVDSLLIGGLIKNPQNEEEKEFNKHQRRKNEEFVCRIQNYVELTDGAIINKLQQASLALRNYHAWNLAAHEMSKHRMFNEPPINLTGTIKFWFLSMLVFLGLSLLYHCIGDGEISGLFFAISFLCLVVLGIISAFAKLKKNKRAALTRQFHNIVSPLGGWITYQSHIRELINIRDNYHQQIVTLFPKLNPNTLTPEQIADEQNICLQEIETTRKLIFEPQTVLSV